MVVATMVIVIMGDVRSSLIDVGKSLAQSLGWDFVEVGNLLAAPLVENGTQYDSQMEMLSAAIRSSTYDWRDVVVSCSVLTGSDQERLRVKGSWVEFVHLKTTNIVTQSRPAEQPTAVVSFVAQKEENMTPWPKGAVFSVEFSNRIDEVCSSIVSGAILHRRSA
jgi:gluconate kinase